jgi:hypothetical protein
LTENTKLLAVCIRSRRYSIDEHETKEIRHKKEREPNHHHKIKKLNNTKKSKSKIK